MTAQSLLRLLNDTHTRAHVGTQGRLTEPILMKVFIGRGNVRQREDLETPTKIKCAYIPQSHLFIAPLHFFGFPLFFLHLLSAAHLLLISISAFRLKYMFCVLPFFLPSYFFLSDFTFPPFSSAARHGWCWPGSFLLHGLSGDDKRLCVALCRKELCITSHFRRQEWF